VKIPNLANSFENNDNLMLVLVFRKLDGWAEVSCKKNVYIMKFKLLYGNEGEVNIVDVARNESSIANCQKHLWNHLHH
jgi:hypothetical protein